MDSPLSLVNAEPRTRTFSRWLVLLQAAACGLIAANIYYAQPLAGLISMELGLSAEARVPRGQLHYGQLLASMGRLARHTPILRRRALYHAALFAAFSLFWTTTPLLLAGPIFGLSQSGIALFALAGVAGAIAAPIAGRVADRGWTRPATALSMLAVAAGFLLTHIAPPGSTWSLASWIGVALPVLALVYWSSERASV